MPLRRWVMIYSVCSLVSQCTCRFKVLIKRRWRCGSMYSRQDLQATWRWCCSHGSVDPGVTISHRMHCIQGTFSFSLAKGNKSLSRSLCSLSGDPMLENGSTCLWWLQCNKRIIKDIASLSRLLYINLWGGKKYRSDFWLFCCVSETNLCDITDLW